MEKLSRTRFPLLTGTALVASLLAACGGGGGGGGGGRQAGIVGAEETKPNSTDTFFVDENRSGQASRVSLVEMSWGRLVDVFDVDQNGDPNPDPVFRDFVINEAIRTDVTNYVLETNPITQRVSLIIQRTKGAPNAGFGTFDDLLRDAMGALPPVAPYGDRAELIENPNIDPDLIARNATLVLRFDDLLDDSASAATLLPETIKILSDYPPQTPLELRIVFDPNFGGVVDGEFHSSRILIDTTVSEQEAQSGANAPINNLGLPASLQNNSSPNIAIRIPTRIDPGSGQFEVLTNLNGAPLSTNARNGPIDDDSPTRDVVRGMRSGRGDDENNGFLSDLNPPQVLGRWPFDLTFAAPDPAGLQGFDFVVGGTFTTPCRSRLEEGDVLSIDDLFLEMRETSSEPSNVGAVSNLRVRVLRDTPVANVNELLGQGLFQSTYDPQVTVAAACWVSFTPSPGIFPSTNVRPLAVVQVSFTEPMDPASVLPFESFQVVRGAIDVAPSATNTVIGEIIPSPDLRQFSFDPVLDLAHQQTGDQYHVRLEGVTDLAGNPLADQLPFLLFTIDPNTPAVSNDGLVLRFDSVDEIGGPGAGENDIRGQFFYDFAEGLIRPRPVSFVTAAADRANVVPGAMIAITTGIQTPLVPLGSKLHMVWRYCDFGWQVEDETRFNLDVTGVNWSPLGGQVLGDFFENFEMRLSHSARLPDEAVDDTSRLPLHENSGLVGSGSQFTQNILGGASEQAIVHPRSLGYRVLPSEQTVNVNGTFLLPYPLNQGRDPADLVTYTWRDTSNLRKAGPNGAGIPTDIECKLGVDEPPGGVASSGEVPTIGLPLLIEIRTYPSAESVGLNSLDISIALNSSIRPFFRSFSSGGFDTTSSPVTKNPDGQNQPTGGFNPASVPAGQTTPAADPAFYIGALDYVTRISRALTSWIDTNVSAPDFRDPVLEPLASSRPAGTDLAIDFRGATGFTVQAGNEPFSASTIDAYGDPDAGVGTINFLGGTNAWYGDIDQVDGARYIQMRFTFLSNIATGLRPELSAVGIAFE